jgi:hypothetical protein
MKQCFAIYFVFEVEIGGKTRIHRENGAKMPGH